MSKHFPCPCCLGDPDTACSACLSHDCWAGNFMCEDARGAGTVQLSGKTDGTCEVCGLRLRDLGVHYHCTNCRDLKPTSMLGHYRNGAFTCAPAPEENDV
jgi:hypothetical protein